MFERLLAAATALLLSLAADAEAPPRGGQAPGWYRMTLGKFEVTALSDGTVSAPVDQLLRNIKPEQEKSLLARAYLKPPVETSVNCFLVNTGSKLVLIDAGAGLLSGPTLGKLLASLKASGYTPEQVTMSTSPTFTPTISAASERLTARRCSRTPWFASMRRTATTG